MTGFELYFLIASAAMGAYSQYEQGKSAERQSKAEAAWHQYNAKVAEREEAAELKASVFEAKQQKRRGKMLLARQRALTGASGVQMVGSPLLVAVDTARQLAIESANIRMTGIRRAGAFRSQSILDISQASAARVRAKGYKRAGAIGAGTSILQGGTSVFSARRQGATF